MTAIGDDPSPAPGVPSSGLVACDLYVSTDGGPFVYWTTVHPYAPTAIFTGQSGHTYAFHSNGHDAAGNTESKGRLIEASTYVPDLTPPTTRVTSVDASSPTLRVSVSGSDAGGSGLAYTLVFVRVDDGAARQIGVLSTASGTIPYEAIADGNAHTYVFYSQGVDGAGNIQPPPSNASMGLSVTATFNAPASLQPTALLVQNGEAERSYIRYVDLMFNENVGLSSLISNGDIQLIQHNLNGGGGTSVSLNNVLHVVDHAIELDFGAAGLGGNPNTNAGDGYYELDVNLDGMVDRFFFYRLLGDVNGDAAVTQADVQAIGNSLGMSGPYIGTDVNGSGSVDAFDLVLARRAVGRRLASGLKLSD